MAEHVPYDLGDAARLTATFRAATITYASGVPSSTLALADPTTITLELTAPSATSPTAYTYAGGGVSKSSTGVYYREITWTEAGEWRAKWTGTGAVAAVESQVYTVQDQGEG
jgi:hypothetical protein